MRIRGALASALWTGLAAMGGTTLAVIASAALLWIESMWSFGILIIPTAAGALIGLGIGFAKEQRPPRQQGDRAP